VTGQPAALGFGVRCERPLRFLRNDGGEDDLAVEFVDDPPAPPNNTPLATWTFRDVEQFTTALYRHDDGYAYATGAGVTLINPSRSRISIPSGIRGTLWEEHLWGVPAILCFLARGDLPLHAAAVEIDGGAILLAAPGHHGKTTLALALHNAGHRVLAEDLTCWRRTGKDIVALPGPALLRTRPDVLEHMPIGDTDVIYRHSSRVYLSVVEGRRGSGRPVPVVGVAFLRKGEGPVRVERISLSASRSPTPSSPHDCSTDWSALLQPFQSGTSTDRWNSRQSM
jgi:hypothetical protein